MSFRNIISYSTEITTAFKSTLYNGTPKSILIIWVPPLTAGVKLDTDDCMHESNCKAGFGELFRDHMGRWLGYFAKLNSSSSLEMEIWGIYRGLTIMLEKGYSNVHIEFDSIMAVQLINEGNPVDHPNQALITYSSILLR